MEYVSSPTVGAVVFLLLVTVEILFYGFSAAIQELNDSVLEEKLSEGDKKAARLQEIVERPEKFINTVQILSTLTGIVFGGLEIRIWSRMLSGWAIQAGWPYGEEILQILAAVIVTCFLVFLLMSVAILTPKRIARKNPEKWSFRLVPFMYGVTVLFSPFTYLITKTSHGIMRIFGIDPYAQEEDVTEEEIISMVNEGHEQGVLLASEAEMIHNIFEFGDKEARDIMTHRKNIIALDGDDTLDEVLDFILGQSNSRFPVYEDDIDNIIGLLHLKDAMKCHRQEELRGKKIREIEELIRPVSFIPETRNIDILFKNMQSLKIHMVVVVDEYGQTAGLVAMEDILEEIVGNILDEYDEDENFIVEQPDHSFLVKGMTPLEELEEVVDIEFEDEDYETLNGFMIFQLDRIPGEDEQPEITYEGYSFKVLSVENKTIESVLISKLPETITNIEITEVE